jgi:hypothetical protein
MLVLLAPQHATYFEAVDPGKHTVENDQRIWRLPHHRQGIPATVGHVDNVTLGFESSLDEADDAIVVLYQQNP